MERELKEITCVMWTLLDLYSLSSRFGEAGTTVLLSFDLGLFWLGKGIDILYSFGKSAHSLSLNFVFDLLSCYDSIWSWLWSFVLGSMSDCVPPVLWSNCYSFGLLWYDVDMTRWITFRDLNLWSSGDFECSLGY